MFSGVTKATEYDTSALFYKITDVRINMRKERIEWTLCGYATKRAANQNMNPIYMETFSRLISELTEPAKPRNLIASLEAFVLALPTYTGGIVE